jgi:ligand-binding sensor domain-containing protein/signal transduction histidine kinase
MRNVRRGAALLAWLLLAWSRSASALNPALDVSQYAHTSWKIREGFTKGVIQAIAQTPDGYLWLGTEFGLVRFDGVRTVAWLPPGNQTLPSSDIWSLLAARDGALWIGTSKGLARWKLGEVTRYPQLTGQIVRTLLQDRLGTVWAGGTAAPAGLICAIRDVGVTCHGQDGSYGKGVLKLYEDRKGTLWAGTERGLWRWEPESSAFALATGDIGAVLSLDEDRDGTLVIGTMSEIRRLVGGRMEPFAIATLEGLGAFVILRDREDARWIATSRGLVHVHHDRTDRYTQSDGLSGDNMKAIFEDREGDVWVATTNGLDRFRDFAVPTFSLHQGLSNIVTSVLAAGDGTMFFGTSEGLKTWNRDRASGDGARPPLLDRVVVSLLQDDRGRIWIATQTGFGFLENNRFVEMPSVAARTVRAMARDTRGNVWLIDQELGLFQVQADAEVTRIPWSALGHKDFGTALVADPIQGGVWLGFWDGGVAYFRDGGIRTVYGSEAGLAEGRVNALFADRDGTLWVATESGLSRLRGGRAATLTSKGGLPCDTVHWVVEDSDRSFWLNTACGLVRVARDDVDAWLSNHTQPIRASVYDASDGIRVESMTKGGAPHTAKSSDGKLWFVSEEGVSVVDPRHLSRNTLPPPVVIEAVTADRVVHDLVSNPASTLTLPALTRDLQIDYTALSLVVPEKNRFKYMLEGKDREWQDVGTRRQAFYNDLKPRSYRFRVIASNNSRVWNETGDTLEFSIPPAWYQRTSVQSAAVVGFLALLWAGYRYRVRQIAHLYDARVQARVDERTRIARDLHDTLLQNFHGVLFRFQAIANLLPDRPVQAKQDFEKAIDQANQAIVEGRDAVQDLRGGIDVGDLPTAISTLGRELAVGDESARPVVNIAIEGTPRALHPIVRDDVYRIAAEALRNAFRHAHARRVEVEIRYDERHLTLRVRDDGKGIDPAVVEQHKPGHFGLPGMRERADIVGGHFGVWSKVGAGAEVELTIPAAAAYATPPARGWRWLFTRKAGTSS